MSNVNAHDHSLTFWYNIEFRVINELISSAQFKIDLQRHVSEILVVPILCKLRTDNADVTKTLFDIAYELDAVIDGCVNIRHDDKNQRWWRPRGMADESIDSCVNLGVDVGGAQRNSQTKSISICVDANFFQFGLKGVHCGA